MRHIRQGIMLVYDVTNRRSFDNIKTWLDNIDKHAPEDVEKMILGNKYVNCLGCSFRRVLPQSLTRARALSGCSLMVDFFLGVFWLLWRIGVTSGRGNAK
jgi:hypothetical protein